MVMLQRVRFLNISLSHFNFGIYCGRTTMGAGEIGETFHFHFLSEVIPSQVGKTPKKFVGPLALLQRELMSPVRSFLWHFTFCGVIQAGEKKIKRFLWHFHLVWPLFLCGVNPFQVGETFKSFHFFMGFIPFTMRKVFIPHLNSSFQRSSCISSGSSWKVIILEF